MVDAVVPEVSRLKRPSHGLSAVCWIFFPALHSRKCKKRKGFSGRASSNGDPIPTLAFSLCFLALSKNQQKT